MKRLFILIYFLPILSGCWDQVELQEIAIITSAAIDRLEDGKTRVAVQIFIPRSITSGETGEDPNLGSTFVRYGEGENMAEAIAQLQMHVPRKLFWEQCKVYIFGYELAKDGIRDVIDYLARHPSPRGSSYLFISEGIAKDLLDLIPPLERYSGDVLKKFTEIEYKLQATLRDVDMGLMGEGRSVVIPLVKRLKTQEKPRNERQTIPIISGAAIIKNEKLVGTLNPHEAYGYMWLNGAVNNSFVAADFEGQKGQVLFHPTSGKVKLTPLIINNQWVITLKFHLEGDIVQNETHLNLMNEEIMDQIKKKFEKSIEEQIRITLNKFQKEYKSDVLRFGRKFHQKYPKEWKKVASNWDEKFSEVQVEILINAEIRKPGYIGPPAALPIDEVVK